MSNCREKHLLLVRDTFSGAATVGKLYMVDVDNTGTWLADTCEDAVRTGKKVPGKTAIPTGTYQLRITMSNRFKKLMPEVLNVPGFTGVRIHGGNTHEDTEGCLLVGLRRNVAELGVSMCAPAVKAVMHAIKSGYTILVVE